MLAAIFDVKKSGVGESNRQMLFPIVPSIGPPYRATKRVAIGFALHLGRLLAVQPPRRTDKIVGAEIRDVIQHEDGFDPKLMRCLP